MGKVILVSVVVRYKFTSSWGTTEVGLAFKFMLMSHKVSYFEGHAQQ